MKFKNVFTEKKLNHVEFVTFVWEEAEKTI